MTKENIKIIKETGNNGSGNIEKRDNWQTPQWLYDKLEKEYNFTFDCCADEENHKTKKYSKDFLNENLIQTDNICWMNPPFSKAKEMFKHFFKNVYGGVCIYRCDNLETSLWQDIIFKYADWIFIPKSRISYEGKIGKGSRFPSALIGFNVDISNELFRELEGTFLLVKQEVKAE